MGLCGDFNMSAISLTCIPSKGSPVPLSLNVDGPNDSSTEWNVAEVAVCDF